MVMVGGVLVSTAMVLASFGTTIIHLYLCIGVIGGKQSFFAFSLLIILDKLELIWIMRNFASEVAVALCNVCFTVPCCEWLTGGC